MRRLFNLVVIGIIVYFAWPFLTNNKDIQNVDELKTELNTLKDKPEFWMALDEVNKGINQLFVKLDEKKEELTGDKQNVFPKVEKPDLTAPAEQTFSIHNVEIAEAKTEAEKQLGTPERISVNEYGTQWHAYHENFQNFVTVSYGKDGNVNGLFTNQDLISSKTGVKFGSPKETVRKVFGEPLTEIRKGLVFYQFQKDQDYDVYQLDGSYVTIFYDKHKNNTVTAVQIISEQLEKSKTGFYTEATAPLKEGFEYQLFDLTNAARVKNGLGVLTWDDKVKETARKHSLDMAENKYFSHTNLEGESPFDRMAEDNITFAVAGENLAYGQFSSIFAHEGLMNSLGHR
ncbi:MAG: CAP domain-containing protein, partial [Mesobacillus sp.]|uniref:CAP domain-containing protein n=1 Tax=Mesobacillus sp. TaxID=2675271 RepID=UPI003C63A671